ncbi:tumor necrosis factor receptor superfamily member 1B isoform X2 [Esox lucius]|uniref:tumor necrosis factor receptor superfamily member 1B isoform X2 n=1 Tax=Esox lucius TaxID=8010 RepID=UPI001476EEDC|nr:tumor necrosis factor receptor superfamily member 1B isoform X2 [Esox lucius]
MVQPYKNKVYTLPYRPDTGELCTNGTTEYYCKNVHMCCSLCSPGTRRKVECSSTSDTVCEPCHAGQYIANFNYTPNCFRCPKCSEDKGLQYVQRCTSSTKAICECKSGMYCILGKSPDCMECASYSYCKPGEGVSTKGTADSDVKCETCPNGTFSDQHSYTQACQPYTDCKSQGRPILTYGNASSNVICGLKINESPKTTTPSRPQLTTLPSGRGHTQPSLQSLSTLPTKLVPKLASTDWLVVASTEGKSPGFDPWMVAGVMTGFFLLVLGMVLCKKAIIQFRRATEENSEKAVIKFDSDGPLVVCNSSIKTICQEKTFLLGGSNEASQPETLQGTTMGSGCFNSLEGLSVDPLSPLQQPSIFQSTLQQPSTLQSSLQQPSTLQSTFQQPGTPVNTPQPSTLQSTFQQPGTLVNTPQPSTLQSTFQQPGTLVSTPQPSTLQSSLQQPSTLQSTFQQPGTPVNTPQPSTLQSTFQQPGTPVNTPQPSTLQSSLQQPSTLQSSLQQPSTLQSSLQQPSTLVSTPQPSNCQSNSSLPSSPLVNVNITVNYPVNIGNGLCSTPTSSTPTGSSQADSEAPLSREEEYVNMPLQEGGKEALTATQESGHYI